MKRTEKKKKNIYDKNPPPLVIIIYDLLTLVSNKNWTR